MMIFPRWRGQIKRIFLMTHACESKMALLGNYCLWELLTHPQDQYQQKDYMTKVMGFIYKSSKAWLGVL